MGATESPWTDEDMRKLTWRLAHIGAAHPAANAGTILGSLSPRVAELQRAAKVEALRDAADRFEADDAGLRRNVVLDLRFWADEIERGER